MSIDTSYIDSLGAKPTQTAKSNQTINQAGFLKLMTTQLKTQDPTAPTDNNQMVQQMATFSQVTGIAEMNQSLKALASDFAASRFGDASAWIGRAALVAGGTASQATNGAYAGQITLPADAKGLTMSLVNAKGETVYAKDLGYHAGGAVDWSWDGKDAAGNLTKDGAVQVMVTATGVDGKRLDATNATWAEIQSVQSPASGTTSLITGRGKISPADVLQLS